MMALGALGFLRPIRFDSDLVQMTYIIVSGILIIAGGFFSVIETKIEDIEDLDLEDKKIGFKNGN